MELKKLRQCALCPWRKSTNPHDIPDGYSEEKHKALSNTIATKAPTEQLFDRVVNVMSCHEHCTTDEVACVGWVYNQLQQNNIPLRLAAMRMKNINQLQVIGEQHEHFEDTLPSTVE